MQSHIAKWGNSLGIRIPLLLVKQMGITEGTSVDLVVEDNQLVIRKQNYCLETLLLQVNQENIHNEIDCGAAKGREEW